MFFLLMNRTNIGMLYNVYVSVEEKENICHLLEKDCDIACIRADIIVVI